MNEGAVFLVVVVVAVLSYRYFAGPADGTSGSGSAAGGRQGTSSTRRQVTPAMVEVIQAMFPNIPPSSIAHDLSRTGSVEVTTNNILSRNSLPPAPPDSQFHRLFPSPQAGPSVSGVTVSTKPDLISRYNLSSRLDDDVPPSEPEPNPNGNGKGKGKAPSQWSQSQSEREANFKKRRDEMILRARKQMIEQGKSEQ